MEAAAPTVCSDATSTTSSDGPVLSVINKRIRSLRKKYNRILQMEESVSQGKPLNKEQEEVLRSKPAVSALIDELEKLRQPLSSAVSEEISLALQSEPISPQQTTSPAQPETTQVQEQHSDEPHLAVEDLLKLLYFGSLFDVKSQHDFTSTMLTRTHERGCCLTYDYVTDDATDLLNETYLDSISMLSGLMTSRPADSSLSHENALNRCIHHAKLWLSNSDQLVDPTAAVSYAGLRERLKKIMDLDYFTTTPEMKAPVEVAAAAGVGVGTYTSFQVDDSVGQYQQKKVWEGPNTAVDSLKDYAAKRRSLNRVNQGSVTRLKNEATSAEAAMGTAAMEVNQKSKRSIIEQQKDNENQREKQEQQLWSWGAGTDGQLGSVRLQDEHLPQLLNLPSLSSAGSVSMLACGGAHVVALTSGGKVLTWGRGNFGQLGHGDMANSLLIPKLVMCLESYFITQVSAGWSHSGFQMKGVFLLVGMDHLASSGMVITESSGNLLYGFGFGKRGQLAISIDRIKSVNTPEIIHGFDGVQIVTIAANGDHSAALSADGELYTWGRGFGASYDFLSPQHLPSSSKFSKVVLGWNHALVLYDNGEVFMLGGNHHGKLSNPENTTLSKHLSGEAVVLERVSSLDGMKIVEIAAGAEHSAVVTEDGAIKTWGWGEHGQLGLGSTSDESSPRTVSLGDEVVHKDGTVRVYCGSGFTYTIRFPP